LHWPEFVVEFIKIIATKKMDLADRKLFEQLTDMDPIVEGKYFSIKLNFFLNQVTEKMGK
jgi:hypothetical protein